MGNFKSVRFAFLANGLDPAWSKKNPSINNSILETDRNYFTDFVLAAIFSAQMVYP